MPVFEPFKVVNPLGERVGINPNGYSVPMMWRMMDGRSWVNSYKTRCRAIFKRGLRWTVYTENDYLAAHDILMKAWANSSVREMHSYERRFVALNKHAESLGIPVLPSREPSQRAA